MAYVIIFHLSPTAPSHDDPSTPNIGAADNMSKWESLKVVT